MAAVVPGLVGKREAQRKVVELLKKGKAVA
jgi:hypothetical protein